jgi:hypothetical protein
MLSGSLQQARRAVARRHLEPWDGGVGPMGKQQRTLGLGHRPSPPANALRGAL